MFSSMDNDHANTSEQFLSRIWENFERLSHLGDEALRLQAGQPSKAGSVSFYQSLTANTATQFMAIIVNGKL